ncbi:MAG: 2'-5' RNA ligase family protein [Chitinophagaceae bacterium]
MNENLLELPGYKYYEYLLVINPHEDLRNKIINIKKEFHEKYKAPNALWGKPHITIAKFVVWQMMEDRIINRLKVAAMGMPAFKIHLKDFGSFPSHTIFINVTTKLPIQELVKQIRQGRRLMKSQESDPHFIDDPYISVSRQLTADQYEKSWLEYSHKSFTGSFIADGMLLLKRKVGDKPYQIVQRFDFMNLPVNTTQGALF